MARRINTPFVVTLGAVLALGAGGVGIYGVNRYLKQRDPSYLTAKGEEAEKKGDLEIALRFYMQAVMRSLEKHTPNAADLCMRTGDLAMKLSDAEKDRAHAESLYNTARAEWEAALGENPRYLPARQRLVAEDHEWASATMQAARWTSLVENTQKLITLSPNDAEAYTDRAEARLQLLKSGAAGTSSMADTVALIEADLKKAIQLDPTKSRPVLLKSDLMWAVQTQQLGGARNAAAVTKLQDQAVASVKDYLKANPDEPDATIGLASYMLQRKQEDEAIKLLEKAYAAHSDNSRLANVMAVVYQGKDPAKAEKVLKDAIATAPNNTDQYRQLAEFYMRQGRRQDAIAAYKDLLQHPKPGGGIISYQNDSWEADAKYEISSLYLDLAEIDGPGTAAGKVDLAQATDAVERFRAAKSDAGRQSILDGRLQLMHENLAQAITYLKRAEANLGGAAPSPGRMTAWLQSKMLLVKAYERQKDWALALQLLDQVLTNSPQNVAAMLERAGLLNRVAQYEQAMAVVAPILAAKPSQQLQAAALRIKAQSLYGLGNREEADKIVASLDSTEAMLALARSHLVEGQKDQALEELGRVLERDPGSLGALNLAILANMQLDRKPAAQKLLDQALAKYPENPGFQMMRATLSKPDGDQMKVQADIINSITDDYSRSMAFADLYSRTGEKEKQLAALEAAESATENAKDRSQDRLTDVVDRTFGLILSLGTSATDNAAKTKYWEKARTYVQKAQRFNLDGLQGKLYDGQLQFAQGNRKEGLATLEQAVNARLDYSTAHLILGQEYMAAGRSTDAAEQFRQAVTQKPDNMVALKSLIYLLLQKGDTASAEQAQIYLKQALLFAPRDAQLTEFRDILAMNGAGDLAEAIRVREEYNKADPNNLQNMRHLAILYVRAKEPSKAIELLKPQYDKNPDDLAIADTLARLYRDSQRTNEALTIYQRFLSSKDAATRFQATLLMGELYQNTGAFEQAIQTFTEAMTLEPAGSDQAERRLADLHFEREDMKNAEVMYQKLLDKETTKDPLVLRRLAEAKIRQDKFADAESLLNTMIFKQNPDDAEGLVLKGFSSLRQGKPADALKAFNTVLTKDPNNLDALHYRAFAQFSLQGDLDQATKDLLTVRDRNPNAINSRLLLARVYRASHHLSEAGSEYRDVVALKPDSVPARMEYAEFLMSLAKIQRNLLPDNQDDIAYTIRAINPTVTLQAFLIDSSNRFPTVPLWQIMAGDLLTLNGRTQDGQKMYAQAYTSSNGSVQAASAYLGSLLRTRNYEDVVALATKVLGTAPDSVDLYLKRASAHQSLNQNEQAVADCGQAMELASKNVGLAQGVAREASGVLGTPKVLEMLRARVAAKPTDVVSKLLLGEALLLNGQPADAVPVLSPLAVDKGTGALRLAALRGLALAKYQSKDFPGAEADYKELLKNSPDDIEALNNLSFLLAEDEKKPKEALSYAEQAVKVLKSSDASLSFVNNGNVYDTYGWVKFLSGDTDGSVVELKKATASAPIAIAYLHLAKAYQKANRKAEASKAIDEGLQLATEQKDPVGTQLVELKKTLTR